MIEVVVPVEEIAARRERVEKARRFERADRVPVIPAVAHRFLVPQVGVRFRDYHADPETMLRTQILAQKRLFENVRTDACSFTGPGTRVMNLGSGQTRTSRFPLPIAGYSCSPLSSAAIRAVCSKT